MKYKEYLKARELRKDGWSINEIKKNLGVSKCSVSTWVRDIELTKEQTERLTLKKKQYGMSGDKSPIRQKYIKIRQKYRDNGKKLYHEYKNDPLFICGCSLYWAEGSKKRNELSFCNSDPSMMFLFVKFIYNYFEIKKKDLKFNIHTHKDNEKSLESIVEYWKKLLNLDDNNIQKEYIDKRQVSGKRGRKNMLHNGIATIRIYSSEKVQMLYGAIEEMAKNESVFINNAKWID